MEAAWKEILGSIAFAIFWILTIFPTVPLLPIGRTAGALLSASLMVIFRVISPEEAYAAVNLPILGLLFGTMVVGNYLERADLFKNLGKLLSWKAQGGKDLLCRVCFVSSISSAFFTNDTSCVVLTEFVLRIDKQHKIPPKILLLALASSANIGSSATPIGNPQNLVIAVQGKIQFLKFFTGLLPAMILGSLVNVAILLGYYMWVFSPEDEEQGELEAFPQDLLLNLDSGGVSSLGNGVAETKESLFRKICVYIVTLGMLIALLLGLNMSWTAMAAALILVVLDFRDARPCLEKVSYSVLVFFGAMFITVEGFNRTGIPGKLWDLVQPYTGIDRVAGVAVLAIAVIVLSNLASNVPADLYHYHPP
ncbi:divalent ion symporter isoform X2 [Wolffia australiana]